MSFWLIIGLAAIGAAEILGRRGARAVEGAWAIRVLVALDLVCFAAVITRLFDEAMQSHWPNVIVGALVLAYIAVIIRYDVAALNKRSQHA